MLDTVLVIPCYNEAARLPADAVRRFARSHPAVRLLFVDDGSTDGTRAVLGRLADELGDGARVLALPANGGKAEAVRQGCLAAFADRPRYVGYWDADLATPLDAVPDFRAVLASRPGIEIVFGARVQLLGRTVRRRAVRHYLGRVFATAASWTLGLRVYDTQCGAKLFRASPLMQLVFRRPFLTRWLFDVEILARLLRGTHGAGLPAVEDLVCELPLQQWHDVAGSKVRPTDFPRALGELARIHRAYLGRAAVDPDRADWLALAPPPPAARAA